MKSLLRYVTPPSRCSYLCDEISRLEYEIVREMSAAEYSERLLQGWRRFGRSLFRPRCPACSACRSLRVDVARFRPNRAQRRAHAGNTGVVRKEILAPGAAPENLELYGRFHEYRSETRGWYPSDGDESSYTESFVENPFPTEEWRYIYRDRLIGVGYVDRLPVGLSAIYYFYDPEHRSMSLGTWNVLCLLDDAAAHGLPHLYLGYYVADCPSLSYKANFVPNEALDGRGGWNPFRA